MGTELPEGAPPDPLQVLQDRYRFTFDGLKLDLAPEHRVPAVDLTSLPLALRAYYALAGRHPINFAHHRLIAPEDLRITDRRLVFMIENQGSVTWAVDDLRAEDPMVFQGVRNPDGSAAWYAEDLVVSDFLIAMLTWTCTGEEPKRPA